METILYKPLFINPQAYYVFPNINGRLEPKTGSGKEPAIFVGNIEVKTIAHGDIGKKQYFYNTNEIDLSAFSNSLVRISLYTSRGNVVLGEWNLDVVEGESEDYIDPEVLASLVAVCICDGKSNNDPDRAVIKNLVDPDNPFIISNAAYKLNSGYGKYEEDFTTWYGATGVLQTSSKIEITDGFKHNWVINKRSGDATINSSKVLIKGIPESGYLQYRYFESEDATKKTSIDIYEDGEYSLPNSTLNNLNDLVGFQLFSKIPPLDSQSFVGLTITQIPSHQGAFVTDGKDDLITSTKTVQEMLGGSNEVTVVSMMLNLENEKITYTNQIRPFQNGYIRNNVISNTEGKCGIYGYKITDISDIFKNRISINDILGDRKDYSMDTGGTARIDGKFSVEGYCFNDGTIGEVSQVAWYWTIISKIALTTDQINQVISYFNLDKHVKPDVYYDVKKQGLSNDTPEADWYLKDFSGNGHDMTLYNFAKKLGSGIGKYEVDFNTWTPQSYVADSAYTSNKLHITNIKGGNAILYTKKGANAMKVKITGIQSFNLVYRYIAENDVWEALEVDRDGIYELPASTTTTKTYYTGFTVPYYTGDCDITIEQIPDYEGALVSDGIDDYGKVENLPIYKDYTVVADREIVDGLIDNAGGGVAIRSYNYAKGAFGFDWKNQAFSFGGNTDRIIDVQRFISYQSKYINNGIQLITGNVVDNNPLYMARLGEENRYSKLALWSFLLFPYSLSEFLLERQLKRYKLGTLYPDMVEFRPIISSNIPYDKMEFFNEQWTKRIYPGDYVEIGATIKANLYLNNYDISTITSLTSSQFESMYINRKRQYYDVILSGIKKSPQKINITIDEYIRYEDIVQPYPAIINLNQYGKTITWGDKLKVGSDIVFVGSANLLPELYTVSETQYNGVTLYPNTIIKVEKSMVFDNARTYLKANEPSCILSPNRLRIPNSSYKILGYIPDLTGKGNHGRLNNFAYTEESGANEDGSIRFDGTDDYITIPTLSHGGKQVLMKVNLQSYDRYLYDQRNNWSQYLAIVSAGKTIAYEYSNKGGKTYIDGILNEHIIDKDLLNITHNITATNANIGVQYTPNIGTSFARGNFAQMALFDFMLFPEISSEDEIKELNDIIGIEGNTDDLLIKKLILKKQ